MHRDDRVHVVALLAFEIAREMVVLEAADRPALIGGQHLFSSDGLTIAEGSWLRTDEGAENPGELAAEQPGAGVEPDPALLLRRPVALQAIRGKD